MNAAIGLALLILGGILCTDSTSVLTTYVRRVLGGFCLVDLGMWALDKFYEGPAIAGFALKLIIVLCLTRGKYRIFGIGNQNTEQ